MTLEDDVFEAALRAAAARDAEGSVDLVRELGEMPRGWPRPVTAWPPPGRTLLDGEVVRRLPIPYIAAGSPEDPNLGDASSVRRALCVMDLRCQVCGDRLGDLCVVVCVVGDEQVTDGAAIHPEPCWRAARRLCPSLADHLAAGNLDVWTLPPSELVFVEHDERAPTVGPLFLRPTRDPDPRDT